MRAPPANAPGGPTLHLHPGREKSLRQRHPWIFSGGVAAIDGSPGSGDTVDVVGADGTFLARAAYSPTSQIRARVWTFAASETIDAAFFARRIRRAVAARAGMLDATHTACRLVHGESDGLPGVVADRYGDVVVVQLSAAGAERWRDEIVAALAAATGATCVYERSDADVRALEGLAPRVGVVRGTLPATVAIVEAGIAYRVDVVAGQKTGFFLDQRDSRATVRALAAGRATLNMFCYTGGFTLAALAGGASQVVSVDSSAEALALARENLADNATLAAARAEWRQADAFAELRKLRDAGASFDLVVLDPPKFAPTAQHAERAARAYKDINRLALKLLAPGGLLLACSCSGPVSADLFQKVLFAASLDAGVPARIVERRGAGPDHPVSIDCPETEYLKAFLLAR